jgi:hypothetical protein
MKIYFGRDSFGSAELHIVTHRHTKVVSPYGAAPPLHRAGFRPVLGTPRYGLLGGFHQGLPGRRIPTNPVAEQTDICTTRSLRRCLHMQRGVLRLLYSTLGPGRHTKQWTGQQQKRRPNMIFAALTTAPSSCNGTSLSGVRCKILLYSCGQEDCRPASLFLGECQDPKPRICY